MMDRAPTSVESLRMARQIGLDAGLRFVYQGNVRSDDGENTLCPSCHTELITRTGFIVQSNRLKDGRCPECQESIEGRW
jgi:pyruvate formate lyase activating enzyme